MFVQFSQLDLSAAFGKHREELLLRRRSSSSKTVFLQEYLATPAGRGHLAQLGDQQVGFVDEGDAVAASRLNLLKMADV